MASKYRFVTATEDKQDKQIQNVNPTGAVWDCSSLLACSSEFIAVPWSAPGTVSIFKTGAPHKTMPTQPYLFGHAGAVIDVAFSPFNARLLATGSDDGTVKIWNLPEGGITAKTDACAATLAEHTKKVGILQYHPTANNILASASTDNTVKVWDLTTSKAAFTLSPTADQLLSISYNLDGSMMCATSKDKLVTIFDSRSGAVIASAAAHEGIKNQRAIWAKRRNQIITCGFGRSAACREVKIWDPRNMSACMYTMEVDKQSAVLMPFIDEDTGLYYLGGKGEGAIRYYELRNDATPIAPASSYNSQELAKGLCMAPKNILDVSNNELARFYKLTTKNVIGVHMTLPRRGTDFQEDFFPPTFASVPAIQADEFVAGRNAEPLLQDMKAIFDKKTEAVIVSASGSTAAVAAPAPKVESKPATPSPAPVEEAPKAATPAPEVKPATPAPVPVEETKVEAEPVGEAKEVVAEEPVAPVEEEAPKAESKPATPVPEEKAATPAPEEKVEVVKPPTPAPVEEATGAWDGASQPTAEQIEAQTAAVAKLVAALKEQEEVLAKMNAFGMTEEAKPATPSPAPVEEAPKAESKAATPAPGEKAATPAPEQKAPTPTPQEKLEELTKEDKPKAKPVPKGMPKPRKLYSDSDSD